MDERQDSENSVWYLRERAKELDCLYRVEELLLDPDAEVSDACRGILKFIPLAWQFPQICRIRISLNGEIFESLEFKESPWVISVEIVASGVTVEKSASFTHKKCRARISVRS